MNAPTVAEALEESTGLVVDRESGRQKRPNIRGTGSKHTLVLIDGRRFSAGYKDFVDIEQIPVDIIQRIEVTRGPTSALYGSDAIGGVVNIITKKPPPKTEARATLQYRQDVYGEGEEPESRGYFGSSAGPFGYLLAGSYRTKEGWDRDGTSPDDGDEQEDRNISARFSFDLNADHKLTAGIDYSDEQYEGLRFLHKKNRQREGDEDRLGYYLQYDAKPSTFSSLMLRYNHSEHENDISTDPFTELTAEENAERSLDQVEGRFTTWLGDKHLLTVGSEFRTEDRQDDTGRDDDIDNLGFYIQDEYQILDPLYLVAGLRYDEHSDFGSELTPRTSAVFSLLDSLRLKASYGTGFRAPSISELFATSYRKRGKWIYQPNPGLDPEESESYEIGIEGEYKRFQAGLTAFRTEMEDLIQPILYKSSGKGKKKQSYYRYENISEATLQGLELEYTFLLPKGFSLSGNWTYMDTKNEQTRRDVEGVPEHKGLLKLGYTHQEMGLRANIRMHYIGERYYADGSEHDYTVFNAYCSKKIHKNFELFAGIDNIFNSKEESDNVVFPQPTTMYAGVTWNY
jgi:outer membrane receptor for ferrienterochelin and colicins